MNQGLEFTSVKSFAQWKIIVFHNKTMVHPMKCVHDTHFQIPIAKVFFYDVQLLVREIVFGIQNKLLPMLMSCLPAIANMLKNLCSISVLNELGWSVCRYGTIVAHSQFVFVQIVKHLQNVFAIKIQQNFIDFSL